MLAHHARTTSTSALSCPLCGRPGPKPFASVDDALYYRCGRCRLTFLAVERLPSRATELATYRLHENDAGDPHYRAFLARLTEPLRRHLTPGMIGLDFGCGPGPAIAPMLREHGLEVIDYDPFFRSSRAALARHYDFITCSEVVEHFHCPGREFQRLDELLRPGGWLGVMTAMLEDDVGFAGWWYRRDPTHVCFFRRQTMRWIAGRFGWRVAFPAPTVTLFRKPGPGRFG
jgi:SAM-dependent methyltransferase